MLLTGGMGIPSAFVYRILPHKLLPYTYTPSQALPYTSLQTQSYTVYLSQKAQPQFWYTSSKTPHMATKTPTLIQDMVYTFSTPKNMPIDMVTSIGTQHPTYLHRQLSKSCVSASQMGTLSPQQQYTLDHSSPCSHSGHDNQKCASRSLWNMLDISEMVHKSPPRPAARKHAFASYWQFIAHTTASPVECAMNPVNYIIASASLRI